MSRLALVPLLFAALVMAQQGPVKKTPEVIKAEIETGGSFGAAARQYSAAPTGQHGGRLDWLALENLPAPVAEKLLKLAPGQVSEPFVLPNAVALFQLNNIAEERVPAPAASARQACPCAG